MRMHTKSRGYVTLKHYTERCSIRRGVTIRSSPTSTAIVGWTSRPLHFGLSMVNVAVDVASERMQASRR